MIAMTDQELFSMGKICQLCQCLPRAVDSAAVAAGVKPAVTIDGVKHFTADAVEAIQQQHARGAK